MAIRGPTEPRTPSSAARALPVPIAAGGIAILIALSVAAARMGLAESAGNDADLAARGWAARGQPPAFEEWLTVRDDLYRAARRSPANAALRERLGTLHARRAFDPDYFEIALEELSRALVLRPTSPYAWAAYAEVSYHLGRTGPAFEAALRNAAMLGPSEAEVLKTVADFGLAVWDEATPATRAATEMAIRAGMQRNPLAMLQVSERRGRLDPACRHYTPHPRTTGTRWAQLCEGTGKT